MSGITLTSEQAGAVQAIKDWYSSIDDTPKLTFTLGGYAGTGKSTIVPFIVDALGIDERDIRFVAYTGKAAMVLRSKGLPATTIHGLIYRPQIEDNKLIFIRRPFVELEDIKLIICDESSMVGGQIKEDLERYNIPVLYIGDHFQLPPVSKDQVNLMANPDYRLETIHRQALDNPILYLAHAVREGKGIPQGSYGDSAWVIPTWHMKDDYLLAADQVICGFNNTRRFLNAAIRKLRGFTQELPEQGDKLICLKNNHSMGLVNGLLGECTAFDPSSKTLDFCSDQAVNYVGLEIDTGVFTDGKPGPWQPDVEQFDFGYALTCHKFQGSEAPKVVVYEELFGWDEEIHRRWKYTAYTRAREKLIVVK